MTLPTLRPLVPLTNEDRARIALARLNTAANDLEGDALLEFRMALSALRDWSVDYGEGAALAMAIFQLEQAAAAAQPAH